MDLLQKELEMETQTKSETVETEMHDEPDDVEVLNTYSLDRGDGV